MVGRNFLDEKQLVSHLSKDPESDEVKADALVRQVQERDYNPPSRQRIMEWQREQDFPICPHEGSPDACNLYKDLKFPDGVYEKIEAYHEQLVQS